MKEMGRDQMWWIAAARDASGCPRLSVVRGTPGEAAELGLESLPGDPIRAAFVTDTALSLLGLPVAPGCLGAHLTTTGPDALTARIESATSDLLPGAFGGDPVVETSEALDAEASILIARADRVFVALEGWPGAHARLHIRHAPGLIA